MTRRPSLSRRGVICILLALLGVVTSGASKGYLAAVGPAPLRYYKPPPVSAKPFALPMLVPLPQLEMPKIPSALSNPPAVETSASAVLPPVLVPQPLAPSGQEESISPQVFLKFFNVSNSAPASGLTNGGAGMPRSSTRGSGTDSTRP